ncbi:MAG: DNA polymerase/3'-5' exonuclease PolX [Anaerolineae bacterium]|nr:DNA polymerase/3'-5' exonuclease PolX [Anaerolineae bacterium]MDQ7034562.1 DNA polymerase/3'-5' exonuclease PolX [Anaerolineae bacterium]
MILTNKEIADIFENIADILEIQGESHFKFLSYRRVSEIILELPRDLQAYVDDGTLLDIPGVGKAIGAKITELVETGQLGYYEERKSEVPLGVLNIKRINGVGPKKAKLFWDELNITSIEALKAAAEQGKLAALAGMGKKSQQKVLDGIESLARRSERTPIGKALPAAQAILDMLLEIPEAQEGAIAGSIRRGRATIGDVDILISSDNAQPIMDAVVNMEGVARILGYGETKSSVELHNGLQVDVRVLARKNWGAALQYFTGSQAHNIKIREIARQKGYSLNEEALRPIDADGNLKPESDYIFCETEQEVYETIGLQWIAPEMREDSGEIEVAQKNELPNLIIISDIQGDLHMHTTYSDGKLSIREMAEAARERGMKYIVITDHSQASVQAGGLKPEEILAQQAEVRQVNDAMGDDLQVLHGVEVDIKADGSLDYDDDILKQLDFVVASLHISLRQEKEKITQRLLNAIQNPYIHCIGHPTARLISKRDPVLVDMDAVMDAAKQHNTALEINCNPERLDLDSQYVRLAIQKGVLLSINTDAHNLRMMDYRSYGIMTARRGWTEAKHVINTWSYAKFIEWVNHRG